MPYGGSDLSDIMQLMFHCIATVARDTNDTVSRLPGTDGEIRTHTVLILNQVPPTNWATSAYNWIRYMAALKSANYTSDYDYLTSRDSNNL